MASKVGSLLIVALVQCTQSIIQQDFMESSWTHWTVQAKVPKSVQYFKDWLALHIFWNHLHRKTVYGRNDLLMSVTSKPANLLIRSDVSSKVWKMWLCLTTNLRFANELMFTPSNDSDGHTPIWFYGSAILIVELEVIKVIPIKTQGWLSFFLFISVTLHILNIVSNITLFTKSEPISDYH